MKLASKIEIPHSETHKPVSCPCCASQSANDHQKNTNSNCQHVPIDARSYTQEALTELMKKKPKTSSIKGFHEQKTI